MAKYKNKKKVMIVWAGTIPGKPFSVNHTYGSNGNSRFMYEEAKEYINTIQELAQYTYSGGIKKKGVWLSMDITFIFADKRIRDFHNCHKIIIDSLEGIIYENDYYIKELAMRMEYGDEFKTIVKVYE